MYCVIQKVQNKKPNKYGNYKELKVTETTFGFTGQKKETVYGYTYGSERFERPVLDAYKISIHESYRENGKVKKKQWAICTIGYYDLIDYYPLYDFASRKIEALADELGIDQDSIYTMIDAKLEPIHERIKAEFKATEEYRVKEAFEKITTLYSANKIEFDSIYGHDSYRYCYDVFGELRNPEYLEKLKAEKEANEEYQRRSREHQEKKFNDYYNGGGGSSYSTSSQSNYTDDEKAILKEIYRMASKKFHPDLTGDDGSKMKFITKLKDQWGL